MEHSYTNSSICPGSKLLVGQSIFIRSYESYIIVLYKRSEVNYVLMGANIETKVS